MGKQEIEELPLADFQQLLEGGGFRIVELDKEPCHFLIQRGYSLPYVGDFDIQSSTPQRVVRVKINYHLDDMSKIKNSLSLRGMLEANKIGYEEFPSRSEAIRRLRETAREARDLAYKLE